MKIRINDRPDIQEIEVIINCVADDPLVNKIISALNTVDAKLLCRRQGETFQLGLADILYIESVDRKTFLYTEEQVYETDRRLYELEDYLKDHSFFRTSKTTIINKASQFTATESMDDRMELVDAFNKGELTALAAIRCLDEGINIPSIKSALILSSNDDYREFVQRRGRILRLYKNKQYAQNSYPDSR